MTDLVDQMFPPIQHKWESEFTDNNYWKTPMPEFPLPDLAPPSPALSARSDTSNQSALARLRNFSLRSTGNRASYPALTPPAVAARRGRNMGDEREPRLRQLSSLERLGGALAGLAPPSRSRSPESSSETYLDSEDDGEGEEQELRLILKGDGAGSVEALEDALSKIDVGDEVSLRVIDRGVGAITETNVSLAAASNAVIVGFNVRPQGKATELADREGVDIRYYSVIYAAIDEIEAALKGLLKPIYEEATLGQAEIREIFRSSRAGIIAGCMVIDGSASLKVTLRP